MNSGNHLTSQHMKINQSKYETELHILGGGPAGLAAAYYAKNQGLDFKLIEGGRNLGGNCRTLRLGDCLFDTGAHRFHDKDPEITQLVKKLLGDDLLRVSAPSHIFHQDRFFQFPLTLSNLVRKLDPKTLFKIAVENIGFRDSRSSAQITNFAEFAHYHYGQTLSEKFLLNYSQKLWGLDANLLSPVISGGRLNGLNLKHFIQESLLGQGESPKHLDGTFFYPRYGFGMIVDKLAESIGQLNIQTSCRITRLLHSNRRIENVVINNNKTLPVSQVISTLPLTLTVQMLEPEPPIELLSIARSIQFRHLILVVFCLNSSSFSDNASIYFPEPKFPFTRLYEPKNRSKKMAPDEQTAIVLELPCYNDEAVWQMPDSSLQDQVWKALQNVKLIDPSKILQQKTFKLPFAYPVLTTGFEAKVTQLIEYCQKFENLHLTGRNALFRYLHLHDLFKLGQLSVEKVIKSSNAIC